MPACRQPIVVALVFGLAMAASGCTTTTAALQCAPGQHRAIEERLFFGTLRPGGVVTDAEWEGFVDDVVVAAFPDGFTTWPAQGAWRGADGRTIREASHMLSVVHPRDAAVEAAITAIIDRYKAGFAQEAVLRTSTPTCM